MAPPFIPYYIDYNVKNQSKTIGVSKKKITFKFGFANLQAVDDGLVGAHCRGSEHEVVFTWSLNSGKRHVTLDGKDVHFSTSGQNGWTSDRTWQHVFSLKVPNYAGTFRCHLISQPAPQGSNIRPFDLRVGGVSIFKFNQIYQLGTPQMTVRKPGGSRANYGGDDEPMSAEERRMLAAAKAESMNEYRKQQERQSEAVITRSLDTIALSKDNGDSGPAPGGGDVDLLMSFDGPPAPAPPMPGQQPPGQMVSSMTLGSEFGASTNSFPGGMPPSQQQSPYGYPQQQQQQQSPYGFPQQQQQPNYGQQQQPNYGQSPYGAPAPFGSPQGSTTASYGGSATTAPTANTSAMTPYQAPPGQAQAPAGYSLGSSFNSFAAPPAPAPAPTQSFAASLDPYAKPPADPWATPAPAAPPVQSSYGQDPSQQQYGGYGQSQSSFQQMQSPGNDTQASFGTFGSAPDFARPPQGQQQQYQYQQQGYGQQQSYGQPPATPGNPYAPPPQYQQQQQFGF